RRPAQKRRAFSADIKNGKLLAELPVFLASMKPCVVGRVGVEPTTNWLKANCSTTELTTQNMVGVGGFELPTSCSQSRRATGLRYTPAGSWLRDLDSNQGPND